MSGLATPLCSRLGIDVPLVQAPIGSATTPELVASVSNAGGLGMLALTWTTPEQARTRIQRVRELTDRPFGVNLVLAFPVDDNLAVCLQERVSVVSTTWGDPAAVAARIHEAGALHLHTVSAASESRQAADAGVDVIVAQGWEAGGHVRGLVATLPLVPSVVDAVAPVPVVAAGGIADGRGLVAVLALGAQAGWLGTRFLTAAESHTHAVNRHKVITTTGENAMHTLCFDGGWPDAPHRAIRNSTLTAWETAGRPAAPDRPGEGDVVASEDPKSGWHLRYEDMMPLPGMSGDLEAMALYAGQSSGLIKDVAPAADIVARIVREATELLSKLSPSASRGY
jgi:NAD(P)H-dependent flavin oxidoreductase YrpB (nitropropane dioxygenase family)